MPVKLQEALRLIEQGHRILGLRVMVEQIAPGFLEAEHRDVDLEMNHGANELEIGGESHMNGGSYGR